MAQNTKLAGYNAGATPLEGVNPVHTIQFGICIMGRKKSDTPETIETKVVRDAESLSISVDGTIEEWNPMDQAGWVRRLMTGKSLGMSMGGKRNYGDEGNDYVAGLAYKTGQDCNSWVSIIFPNLDQLLIPAVINVTSLGGDSTSIDALEWEAQSDGKPTYIEYSPE
uniref:Major tail protein n=1 Tax=Siphoviridae sp. ctrap8 TaxID=2827955 RepID=A0A8S5SRK4_9CAUD|nr:MAG TPA: major tail protein [Siphoviridae sp. ctrap8]